MFIEIPMLLKQNDPNDNTDYDELGISEPEYPIQEETVLLNTDAIERVNRSGSEDYKTVIWTFDGNSYFVTIDYEEVKAMILNKCL